MSARASGHASGPLVCIVATPRGLARGRSGIHGVGGVKYAYQRVVLDPRLSVTVARGSIPLDVREDERLDGDRQRLGDAHRATDVHVVEVADVDAVDGDHLAGQR